MSSGGALLLKATSMMNCSHEGANSNQRKMGGLGLRWDYCSAVTDA